MKKVLLTFMLGAICSLGIFAQSVDQLKQMRDEKKAAADALMGEVADLTKQIDEYPGWKYGGVGVVGFNLLQNNNWFALGTPNSKNNALNLGLSGFANLDREKYFWRNLLTANISRSAAWTDGDNDDTKTVALVNGLDLSSLFGYKIAPKWAVSAEGKWTSSILEFDAKDVNNAFDDDYKVAFNAPGQLTVSAGLTWLPITNLVVLIHPLGYQKNWPGELISAAGCKIGATYTGKFLSDRISWSSNFSSFIPYGGAGDVDHKDANDVLLRSVNYETGDLVTWEWINGFSTSLFKGLGVAFNLGLKGNKQQANSGKLLAENAKAVPNILGVNVSDNPLQSYYTLGLSYTF